MATKVADPETARRVTSGVRRVLFIGSWLRKLHFTEIAEQYTIAASTAHVLQAAKNLLTDADAWDAVLVDSRVAEPQELQAFFSPELLTRLQRANNGAGVEIVIMLDRLHESLRPFLTRFARFVSPDDSLDEIATGLHLTRLKDSRLTTHVVVFSAKGGSGKTSVVLSVAAMTARLWPERRVGVVDADLFDGNVALSLGVAERARSILELAAAARQNGVTPQVLANYITPLEWRPSGKAEARRDKDKIHFEILAAPARSTYQSGVIDPNIIAGTYDTLAGMGWDSIYTDAPPDIRAGTPFGPALFDPARLRNMVILVLTGPRKFERDGFSRMCDYLRAKHALERTWLVYTQLRPYRRDKDTDYVRSLDRLAEEHGLRGVAGTLPYDYAVEDAQEQGVPIFAVRPAGVGMRIQWMLSGGTFTKSPFQAATEQIARFVMQIYQKEAEASHGMGSR